jgi:hypothetical protein
VALIDFTQAKIMFVTFAYARPELLGPLLQSVQDDLDDKVVPYIWVDDSGSHPEVDRLVDASGFEVRRPEDRLPGFIQRAAMHEFLDDPSRGDILVVSDGDMLLGHGAFTAMRNMLTFWWQHNFAVGMLCAGIRPNNFRMKGIVDSGDSRILMRHGSEAFSVFPRVALEKAIDNLGKVPQRMASLKNALNRVDHSRGTPIKPPMPVAHIGAFNSYRNPDRPVEDHLFLDEKGTALNPRPDLFDVQGALETCAS